MEKQEHRNDVFSILEEEPVTHQVTWAATSDIIRDCIKYKNTVLEDIENYFW